VASASTWAPIDAAAAPDEEHGDERLPIDVGEDSEDADHLSTPEARLRVGMARQ
jgi:hypothetical protein